jgi:cytosine deaminase
MPRGTITERDQQFMRLAFDQMKEGYEAGGVPVGSVITEGELVLAAGHNKRVQDGDPIAHGRWMPAARSGTIAA